MSVTRIYFLREHLRRYLCHREGVLGELLVPNFFWRASQILTKVSIPRTQFIVKSLKFVSDMAKRYRAQVTDPT